MDRISLSTEAVPDGTIIKIAGRFSVQDGGFFRDELRLLVESDTPAIFIDFTDLSFISSAAIGILVGTTLEMNRSGRFLGIFGANPSILDVFRMTGVDSVLRHYENFNDIIEKARQFQ